MDHLSEAEVEALREVDHLSEAEDLQEVDHLSEVEVLQEVVVEDLSEDEDSRIRLIQLVLFVLSMTIVFPDSSQFSILWFNQCSEKVCIYLVSFD